MKRKYNAMRLWILAGVLVAAGVAVLGPKYLWGSGSETPDPLAAAAPQKGGGSRTVPVLVAVATPERVLDGIRAVGSLRPFERVELSAETSGKVEQILFDEGAHVAKDQILLRINDDDLQAQLRRYEFQKKTLGERLERQRILLEREAISLESFDEVQTEYNMLLADMQLLEVKINRCVVRAPFAGRMGFRLVSVGAYITPATPIGSLVDLSTLRLEFSIPEKYNTMKLGGLRIYFTTEGSKVQNTATVYAVEPTVDEKTRTLILRALCPNATERLRPGMLARVVIPTSALVDRVMVPTEAIVPSMEGKSVWVVRNNTAVSVSVDTGIRLENTVEVIRGLEAGDSVIITGLMQLREGAKVKVTN